MRTPTLARKGCSAHHVRTAIDRGELVRVRRGWVATADADPMLVGAARAGVVLTCITQARRLGLWVSPEARGLHVGAASHAGGVRRANALVHWGRPPVVRHPDELVDPIENVLWSIAQCMPEQVALPTWESALRKGLVALEEMSRLALPPAARHLCDIATPWSDSGLESFVPVRLRWLRLPIVPQVWIDDHRVDFLIGERLALQIDGAHHVGAQREADILHDARLTLLGFHVIRVGYFQVVDRWPQVQDLVLRAVAQGLHRSDRDARRRS